MTLVTVRLGGGLLSGSAQPGESVSAAVRRVLADAGHPATQPDALDLSGPTKAFTCDAGTTFAFRAMTHADLPDVMVWQEQPHVARWYHRDDPANASESYVAAIDGKDPTRMWILEVNGRSVGFVQDYRIGDHPEWAIATGEADAIGFDYAIGDPALIGRGVGTGALWAYLSDVVRPHYLDATMFFAAPDHRNAASLRVLDKLGFTRGLWFDEPRADGGVDTVVSCTLDVRRMFG